MAGCHEALGEGGMPRGMVGEALPLDGGVCGGMSGRPASCGWSPPSVGYADISPSRGEIARLRRGRLTELPAGGSGGLTAIAGMAEEGGLPSGGGVVEDGWFATGLGARCLVGGTVPLGRSPPLEGEMPGRAEGGMDPATRLGGRHFRLTGEFVAGCRGSPLPAGGHPLCRRRRHLPLKGGDRPPAAAADSRSCPLAVEAASR